MHSSFIHRVVVTLLVILVTCLAGAAAAGGQELPRITPPRAFPVASSAAPGTERPDFVPVGAVLSARAQAALGGATLSGIVSSPSGYSAAPVAGAAVKWWLDGATGAGTTVTDAEGMYTLTGVPGATANGNVAMSTDLLGYSCSAAYLGTSWPAAGDTEFDFRLAGASATIVRGGPWFLGSRASMLLWSHGTDATLQSRTDSFAPSGGSPDTSSEWFYGIPGRYNEGAVYWWTNQGVELNLTTPVRVAQTFWSAIDGQFLDADNGWVLLGPSDFDSALTVCAFMRTTDGARSWQSYLWAEGTVIRAVDFANAQHGWAVGRKWVLADGVYSTEATVFSTEDGGATWSEQSLGVGGALLAVDFNDALHGCAVGEGGAVYWTADGGINWHPGTSGVATSTLRDVSFADALRGWACGDGVVIATSDGGATWRRQRPGGILGGTFDAIDTADGTHIAVAAPWPADNRLWYSADGGETWQGATPTFTEAISSIDFADGTHAWAISGRNDIFGTIDGGATWALQRRTHTPVSPLGYVCALSAIDATHAWAVGPWALIDTVDGTTWSEPEFTADQTLAQRFTVQSRLGASGNPGSAVKLTLSQFPKGWVSDILGEPDYPVGAVERRLGGYTSQGGSTERKTVTLPKTAKPGYFYWFALGHTTGPLYLYAPFQVSLMKANDTSIRAGESVRLTGVIPTQGHRGSTPGKVKRVALFKSTVSATKGFKFVKYKRADGYGKFNLGTVSPTRTTWYIVLYPGDKTYWEDVTSAVKVTVR